MACVDEVKHKRKASREMMSWPFLVDVVDGRVFTGAATLPPAVLVSVIHRLLYSDDPPDPELAPLVTS